MRQTAMLVVALLALAVPACASADATPPVPDDPDEPTAAFPLTDGPEITVAVLEAEIGELRIQAKYAEALEPAERLLALRREDPDSRPFEIGDAERLVATLEFAAGLPEESRRELGLADSLEVTRDVLWMDGRRAERAAVAERQLEIRRRLLGDEHPDVAYSLDDLAMDLDAVGESDRACELSHEALKIRRKLLGDEHPDVILSLANLAGILESQGDYAGAESRHREALATARRILRQDDPALPFILHNLASLLHAQGDYADGESLCREALEINRGLHGEEHPHVSACLNTLGALRYSQGDYGGAESLYREALEMDREFWGEEHPIVAMRLGSLAVVLQEQGRYADSESIQRKVLELRRKLLGDEHPEVATDLNNLASVLSVQGKYADAESLYREALALTMKLRGDEHPDVALRLGNVAHILHKQGDYAAAEPLYREALAMRRRLFGSEHPWVANGLHNLASHLSAQGDRAGAEPLFREALAMRRSLLGETHPLVARTLNNLAFLLQAGQDYTEAERLHREALAIQRESLGNQHPDVALSLANLATLLEEQGDHAGAEPFHREALAMRRTLLGDEHPDVATSLNNVGGCLMFQGDYVGAEPFIREALAMNRKLQGECHPNVVISFRNLGNLLALQDDYSAAEVYIEEAASRYEVARLRAGPGLARAGFMRSPYLDLARARIVLGKTDEAWAAAEKARARSLADLLMAAGQRDLNPREVATEDSLSRRLAHLERELAVRRAAARSDTAAESSLVAEEVRNDLLACEAEWSAFQREIAARYPVTEGQAYSIERIRSALPEGTAIIGWMDFEVTPGVFRAWVYVVRRSGPVAWARLPLGSRARDLASPFERARAIRNDLATPRSERIPLERASRDLWNERIEPVASSLGGVTELIVVPSGAMSGLPIEILVDGEGELLGERFAVSYVPSATIHTWLTERPPMRSGNDKRALLVGDPPFTEGHLMAMELEADGIDLAWMESLPEPDIIRSALAGNEDALGRLSRLPGTRTEIAGIAGTWPEPTVLVGPDASEQELVHMAESGDLAECGTIHFATHAFADDARPDRCALVLSQVGLPDPLEAAMEDARVYDGLVTAQEIVQEWELDADLVVLSACETGLGKEVIGEGYVGFAHAFLQSGARSLLVSLWEVEDEATSLLMRRFYENRFGSHTDERGGLAATPMPKAEALQEAKAWLRNRVDASGRRPYKHPFFWSAFVLLGGSE